MTKSTYIRATIYLLALINTTIRVRIMDLEDIVLGDIVLGKIIIIM